MRSASVALGVLTRALDLVVGVLLVAIVAITLAGVVARYGLGTSLAWGPELTTLLYVWMIVLAAAKAGHMRITMIVDVLPPVGRQAARLVSLAISLACLAVLVDGSLALWDLTAGDRFTALPVSQSLFFVAVVVGGALWALVIVARFAARRGDEPEPAPGGMVD
ncbi:TRAP transporter small permease [Acuticoccus sp.]|uniref:TRAP transporter small permease n=1 Tax=Acuticoccus sp. TaxID=1904378 RepID=UPI003B52C230